MPIAFLVAMAFSVFTFRQLYSGEAQRIAPNFPKERAADNYVTGIEIITIAWSILAGAYLLGLLFGKRAKRKGGNDGLCHVPALEDDSRIPQ